MVIALGGNVVHRNYHVLKTNTNKVKVTRSTHCLDIVAYFYTTQE